MSDRIITLNGDKPKKLRGSDLISVNQAMNMVLNACGPIALLAEEIKARQIALEDHVGFTYVAPVDPPDIPVVEPSPGGDSE